MHKSVGDELVVHVKPYKSGIRFFFMMFAGEKPAKAIASLQVAKSSVFIVDLS